MIQVVTAVRRDFVQGLFTKYVIDMRSLMYFLPGWVRNVGQNQ